MKVLITGGAGFIGSHVAKRFLDQGDDVTVVDLRTSNPCITALPNLSMISGDITDPRFPELVQTINPDVLIHAAAQVSVPLSMQDPKLDRRVNVVGTERVIEGVARLPFCRLVFLSTGGAIYGHTDKPASETSLPRLQSFYGAHKYLAERYIEFSEIPYAIARLANVYGPGQRSDSEGGVAAIFAEKLLTGDSITIYGDGEQTRDFVHAWDVADAIASLAVSDKQGIWNIGSGTQTSINQLLDEMQGALGKASSIVNLPDRPGDIRHSCLSSRKILRDLNWMAKIHLHFGIGTLNRSSDDLY